MGRLVRTLTRLGCAVAVVAVSGAGVGCFEPGIVPERWVPSHWEDPLLPLHSRSLSVWIIVPHGNPYATDKTKLAKRVVSQPPPMSPSLMKEQTVGSFGVSSTELPEAMRAANGSRPPEPPALVLQHDPRFDPLDSRMERAFRSVQVSFKDESEDDVEADLKKDERPDVVMGNPLPEAAKALAGKLGVVTSFSGYSLSRLEIKSKLFVPFEPQALVVVGSHNLTAAQARAFAIWLADNSAQEYYAHTPESDAAAKVAERALCRYVLGGSMGGDADPEMVRWTEGVTDLELLEGKDGNCSGRSNSARFSGLRQMIPGELQIAVVQAQAADYSAEVMLRVSGISHSEAPVRHVQMVLRRDDLGHWRILQMSFDQTKEQQLVEMDVMARAGAESERIFRNEATLPLGISQAAPFDGDRRSPQPDLWWDNLGGATLQVVEWQFHNFGTSLFFVPDSATRLQTRVTAGFASMAGSYRWRVWSVGADGTIVISPWRTLGINPA